jgi:hypothetical protein
MSGQRFSHAVAPMVVFPRRVAREIGGHQRWPVKEIGRRCCSSRGLRYVASVVTIAGATKRIEGRKQRTENRGDRGRRTCWFEGGGLVHALWVFFF